MANQHFDFKEFSIQQERCAMKVGTDGVLLGSWFAINNEVIEKNREYRLLDIGTGTGLIALMAAQRLSEENMNFFIDAIEIESIAAEQAKENVNNSKWQDSIRVTSTSLAEFSNHVIKTQDCYDFILCNPPFYNASLKPEDKGRAIARHKDSLPLTEITDFARDYLTDTGELSLIYPLDYDSEVMTAAALSGLHIIKICDVITKKGKPCKRRMATLVRSTHPKKEIDRQLLAIKDEKGNYTNEYLKLVEKFYLRLV